MENVERQAPRFLLSILRAKEEAMGCRGIRGAITVEENTIPAILEATERLLSEIVRANQVALEDVVSVIFTATPDLDAVYPAVAARQMGWTQVPLMCVQEMQVPGSLSRCLRVLIHWETKRGPAEIHHVYLEGAKVLRPDLNGGEA